MATRKRYLVAYDIRDDERLRSVCTVVKNYGDRLQYSVFVCDLAYTELLWLKRDLGSVIHHAVDSVVFIDLGVAEARGADCFEFMGHRPYDLPSNAPQVW